MSGIPLTNRQDELAVQTVAAPASSRTKGVGWYDALASHLILFPMLVFVIHFVIIQAVGNLAVRYALASTTYENSKAHLGYQLPGKESLPSFILPFTRWDGIWFGYSARYTSTVRLGSSMEQFGSAGDSLWPLLSWVMHDSARVSGHPN